MREVFLLTKPWVRVDLLKDDPVWRRSPDGHIVRKPEYDFDINIMTTDKGEINFCRRNTPNCLHMAVNMPGGGMGIYWGKVKNFPEFKKILLDAQS